MQLNPYPEYKESGQPFLGKIPAHWDLFRNGRLFSQRNETGFGDLPILEVSLKTGVRVRDMDNLKRKQVMADREKYKRAAQGDIAYNMMRMWQGAIGVAPVDGLVSPAYVVVRPFPEVDCRYFSYLFRTTAYMNEVDAYSRGIVKDRNRLYWQDFKRMPSVVPPIAEQREIVRFLNHVGGKIQRFIRNKRRLIELLKEQKQNIINQAVTRGVDPNVKLKPSGVEWIGDIPEHWNLRKFKHCAHCFSGGTPSKAVEKYWKGELPWVSPKDMKSKYILDAVDHISEDAVLNSSVGVIEAGRVLMVVRSGILRRTIPSGISTRRVAFNQDIKAIATNPTHLNSEYLHALVEGCEKALLDAWRKVGATVESIEHEFMANTYLPLPSLKEQGQILAWIESESYLLDQSISKADREIELMREYRARLIADVVTGQVDVRGIEVPEIAEEELRALEEGSTDADDLLDADEDLKAAE